MNDKSRVAVTVMETDADITQSASLLADWVKKRKTVASRAASLSVWMMAAAVLLSAAAGTLAIFAQTELVTVTYILLAAVWLVVFVWFVRKRRENLARIQPIIEAGRKRLYNGEQTTHSFDFGESELAVTGLYVSQRLDYSNIDMAVEFAEGLCIMQKPSPGFWYWLPARFIGRAQAAEMTALLRDKLGRRYSVVTALAASSAPDALTPAQRYSPTGERLLETESEPPKGQPMWAGLGYFWKSSKRNILMLVLLSLIFWVTGFFKDVVSMTKLAVKIIRMVSYYAETGTLGSGAELIDTAVSLLITATGFAVSFFLLAQMVSCGANIISNARDAVREAREVKAVLQGRHGCQIYDDAVVSSSDSREITMLWSRVGAAEKKGGYINIYDGGRWYMRIPAREDEKRERLCELLEQRLGKGWSIKGKMKKFITDRK